MSSGRMLLGQKISYVGTHGGANKANRAILSALARKGWECLAVVPFHSIHNARDNAGLETHLIENDVPYDRRANVYRFTVDHVTVHAVEESSGSNYARSLAIKQHFRDQLLSFDPDCVLVASEDPGYALLTVAAELAPRKTLWFARSASMVGVGPKCFFRDARIPDMIARLDSVVVNSHYLRRYLLRWAGVDSVVVDAPTYKLPPRDIVPGPFVTIINPCGLKGIDIAIELAKTRPLVKFCAVPMWGTTSPDLSRLKALANVAIVSSQDDIGAILRQCRIILVPSLWDESFGRIVIEAMLWGIPVLASNVGGLPEAKLGVPYLLPVNPIQVYLQRLDENMVRVPVVPRQNIDPWLAALDRLITQPRHYNEISQLSREAASSYVAKVAEYSAVEYIEGLVAEGRQSPRSVR